LQDFDYDGYSLNQELSHDDNWIFCRGWLVGFCVFVPQFWLLHPAEDIIISRLAVNVLEEVLAVLSFLT
jgi:hypothetical protein